MQNLDIQLLRIIKMIISLYNRKLYSLDRTVNEIMLVTDAYSQNPNQSQNQSQKGGQSDNSESEKSSQNLVNEEEA